MRHAPWVSWPWFEKRKEPQVKIKEVPQKPPQRTWRISPAALYGWTVLTEPEAREVWEFFGNVFGRWNLTAYHSQQLAEKDAEIARLKEQKKYNADQVVELSNEVSRLRGWLDLMNGTHSLCTDVRGMCFRARAGEKVPECPSTSSNGSSAAWFRI
jgi:hypothetical protein